MSERDLDVLALIDRAATDAPPMHVPPTAVVEGGRRKVRRHRAAGAGMGLATLALAGALWFGPGQELLSSPSLAPAGQTSSATEDGTAGEPDATGPVAETGIAAETGTAAEAGDPVQVVAADGTVFTLSVDGDTVTATTAAGGEPLEFPTVLDPRGGPLATLWGEGRPVFLVRGWDLTDPATARLATGPDDEGQVSWVEPEGAARVQLADGTPVAVLLVPEGVSPTGFGEERDGRVSEVHGTGAGPSLPVLEGIEVQADGGGALTASRDGQVLEPLAASLDGEPRDDAMWVWTDTDGRWLIVGEAEPWREIAPVVRSRDGMLHVRPDLAMQPGTVVAGDRELVATLATAEDTLVGAVAVDAVTGGDDVVAVLGGASSTQLLPQVQGAPNARVSLDPATGLWVLHQQPGDPMVAGAVDRLMVVRQVGADVYQLVAVVPGDSSARVVPLPGGPEVLADGEQEEIAGTDLATWTLLAQLPSGVDPLEAVAGVDTTGDGQADLLLGEVLATG